MTTTPEHSFRTKTGTCTITAERIVLAREGARGALASGLVGSSMPRVLLVYAALGVALLGLGVADVASGEVVPGALLVGSGAVFLWNVVASRRYSAAPVIERSAIRGVVAHRPRPPFTRGYFAVVFDDGGTERTRLILLPGTGSNGAEEYAKAERMMAEAGLIAAR